MVDSLHKGMVYLMESMGTQCQDTELLPLHSPMALFYHYHLAHGLA